MAETDKPVSVTRTTPQLITPLLLASSPHIATPVATRRLMCNVLIALAPVTIFGIVIFGLPALLTVLISIVAALFGESIFRIITKQPVRIKDGSAAVTGLLMALILPPSTPLWMTALGAIFAVVVAKEFFGGLGANVFNPALVGRAFLLMSFPAAITTWAQPTGWTADAVSGATPLGIVKLGGTVTDVGAGFLSPVSDYYATLQTLFIGNHAGCIGESSVLLILVGFIFLLATKTIDWRTPVFMCTTGFVVSLIVSLDVQFALFSILSGGLLFGAVFMATDYVSTPVTSKGMVIFGIGAGIITMLIRTWGNYPEGVMFSILIMNAVTPYLNKLLTRKYGFVPKKKPAQGGSK
ncbi:RnfABCDGE type electron transport complex subunit D [Breznakiellaceae bacterium SP9]